MTRNEADMDPVDFLSELSRVVGAAEAVSVASALKQDSIVWSHIASKNNFKVMFKLAGSDAQNWNPVNLAMTVLGIPLEDIRNFMIESANPLETSLINLKSLIVWRLWQVTQEQMPSLCKLRLMESLPWLSGSPCVICTRLWRLSL